MSRISHSERENTTVQRTDEVLIPSPCPHPSDSSHISKPPSTGDSSSPSSAIPDDLPQECYDLAYEVARGVELEDALLKLRIPQETASPWISSPWWLPLIRSHVMTEDEIALELDRMIPTAVSTIKDAINGEAPSSTRLNTALSVLGMRGLSSLPRKSTPTFRVTEVEYLRASVKEFFDDKHS